MAPGRGSAGSRAFLAGRSLTSACGCFPGGPIGGNMIPHQDAGAALRDVRGGETLSLADTEIEFLLAGRTGVCETGLFRFSSPLPTQWIPMLSPG